MVVCFGSARAGDVLNYSVAKLQSNVQTNTSAPAPTHVPYNYVAQVRAAASGSINGASVTFQSLFPLASTLWLLDRTAPSQTFLDIMFPAGNQNFSINTVHNGTTNLTLSLPSGSYPNAPHISNFSSMKAMDPTVGLAVNWDAFTGGTTNDLIELQILNTAGVLFDSGAQPKTAGALDGTATGITIPAGTLVAGHGYIGRLMFARIISTNNAYAPGYAAYAQQTEFYMSTVGATPPILTSVVPVQGAANVPANAKVTLTFDKAMGSNFSLSVVGTTNPVVGNWSGDGQTLIASSDFNWPANLMTWSLNTPTYLPVMGDTNNSPLMTETLATAFTAGVNTLPGTPQSPSLQLSGPAGDGSRQILLTGGEAYRAYQLQYSPDLVNWTNLGAVEATSATAIITDPTPATTNRYYRIAVVP